MSRLQNTPFDSLIRERIGLKPGENLIRERVRQHQLQKFKKTLLYAAQNSPFYRRHFSGLKIDLIEMEHLDGIPFTRTADLLHDPFEFLCIPKAEINTKIHRLYDPEEFINSKILNFLPHEVEGAVDFFRCGMSNLVQNSKKVLILVPHGLPGDIGDLIYTGSSRAGADGVTYGEFKSAPDLIDYILSNEVGCIVGSPVEVLSMVRHPKCESIPRGSIRTILLVADYVPHSIANDIEFRLGCNVYRQYYMSDLGYGGGFECDAHDGYHLPEDDLLFEIINPDNGMVLPEGVTGEIVVTTLNSRAMPLIRYRTGEIARYLPEYCSCGSVLRRLSDVLDPGVTIAKSVRINMALLDEVVFSISDVLDFKAELVYDNNMYQLSVNVHCDPSRFPDTLLEVRETLTQVPDIRYAITQKLLNIQFVLWSPKLGRTNTPVKRTIGLRHH